MYVETKNEFIEDYEESPHDTLVYLFAHALVFMVYAGIGLFAGWVLWAS